MELTISINDARKICKLDNVEPFATCRKPNDSTFVVRQAEVVRVACNSWFACLQDCGVADGPISVLKQSLLSFGLSRVVECASTMAGSLLEGFNENVTPHKWAAHYAHDRSLAYPLACCVDSSIATAQSQGLSDVECVARILQLLLYLERFTYEESDAAASIDKFVAVNATCRLYAYDWTVWPGQAVVDGVRQEMSNIFTRDFSYDILDCHFTNGSLTDAPRDITKKWEALCATETCYKRMIVYPLPGGKNGKREVFEPHLIAVPKKMTSKRIIAPEDSAVNYFATGALAGLRRMLKANGNDVYINEHDQSVNQALACDGSKPVSYGTDTWATIDMSSASDSIGRDVFMSLTPGWLRPILLEYMAESVVLPDGRHKKLFMLFPSGNPLTWLTEACYFLGLARFAVRLAGYDNYRTLVYAYGDDLIVPSGAFETVCEVLEAFGHTVNRRKSYGHGFFRESCGGWYYEGHDVTPMFWPRRVVSGRYYPENLARITDLTRAVTGLQHAALLRGLTHLRQYLESAAYELCPKMTSSPIEDDAMDLWDECLDPIASAYKRHWRCSVLKGPVKRSPLMEHVLYYEYLEMGPVYLSKLDELLKVSSSRRELLSPATQTLRDELR
jgi:hypothetical protein